MVLEWVVIGGLALVADGIAYYNYKLTEEELRKTSSFDRTERLKATVLAPVSGELSSGDSASFSSNEENLRSLNSSINSLSEEMIKMRAQLSSLEIVKELKGVEGEEIISKIEKIKEAGSIIERLDSLEEKASEINGVKAEINSIKERFEESIPEIKYNNEKLNELIQEFSSIREKLEERSIESTSREQELLDLKQSIEEKQSQLEERINAISQAAEKLGETNFKELSSELHSISKSQKNISAELAGMQVYLNGLDSFNSDLSRDFRRFQESVSKRIDETQAELKKIGKQVIDSRKENSEKIKKAEAVFKQRISKISSSEKTSSKKRLKEKKIKQTKLVPGKEKTPTKVVEKTVEKTVVTSGSAQ